MHEEATARRTRCDPPRGGPPPRPDAASDGASAAPTSLSVDVVAEHATPVDAETVDRAVVRGALNLADAAFAVAALAAFSCAALVLVDAGRL